MKQKFMKQLGLQIAEMPAPVVEASPVLDPRAGEIHPSRYPKHPDPNKGQVLGGICNTTRCDNDRAHWWNWATHGFYCRTCSRGINYDWRAPDVCIRVEEKPTVEQMNLLSKHRGILPDVEVCHDEGRTS